MIRTEYQQETLQTTSAQNQTLLEELQEADVRFESSRLSHARELGKLREQLRLSQEASARNFNSLYDAGGSMSSNATGNGLPSHTPAHGAGGSPTSHVAGDGMQSPPSKRFTTPQPKLYRVPSSKPVYEQFPYEDDEEIPPPEKAEHLHSEEPMD